MLTFSYSNRLGRIAFYSVCVYDFMYVYICICGYVCVFVTDIPFTLPSTVTFYPPPSIRQSIGSLPLLVVVK